MNRIDEMTKQMKMKNKKKMHYPIALMVKIYFFARFKKTKNW